LTGQMSFQTLLPSSLMINKLQRCTQQKNNSRGSSHHSCQ
jgi:hypothetical protein